MSVVRLKHDVWCQCTLYKFQKQVDFTNIDQDLTTGPGGVLEIKNIATTGLKRKM